MALLIQTALKHHQAGRLSQAEAIYRQILQVEPNHPDALHYLGAIAYHAGKNEIAVDLISKAICIKPSWLMYCNLGLAFHAQGNLDAAAESYRKALSLEPNDVETQYNLGRVRQAQGKLDAAVESYRKVLLLKKGFAGAHYNLGKIFKDQGKLDAAIESYRKALLAKPDFVEAHVNLGNIFKDQENLDAATDSYRKALSIQPNFAEVYYNLGNIFHAQGRLDAAVESHSRAISIKPEYAEAYYNLGITLHAQNRLDAAVESYYKALSIKPEYADAYFNLGITFHAQGRLDEAVASYQKVLSIKPEYAGAYFNLGNLFHVQGNLDEAIESYQKTLLLKPDFADARHQLGNVFQEQGKFDAAIQSYQYALSLKPDFAESHNNLGMSLMAQGKIDEAVECYQRALKLKPDYAIAYSNLLYLHAFTRDISPESECGLAANWENVVLDESERAAAREMALSLNGPFSHTPRAGRKLRVGVVSAELGQHAVAEFLEPFLEQLDRSHFHINLYPTAVRLEPRAGRFMKLADEYKSLVGVHDDKAADLIRSDRIDVLIDTTGHMNNCRLGIFARRAAPVQCHYIGYHGSTGLTEMDWYIADEVLLPTAYDSHFREGIWRLPRIRMCYKGDVSLPGSDWKPDPDGVVSLGSFNNLTKVREETLGLWARVMNAIPGSRLLLKDKRAADQAVQARIRTELFRYGINGERVEFIARTPDWRSHMALYDRLDIALDTIPLNSETTAFDALWMGVPLVALEGGWVGGRQASTILAALKKPEWIAHDKDDYVAKVVALAKDVEGRKLLRATQRSLMAGSPLCDANGLARQLENAFEEMFDQWLAKCEFAMKAHGKIRL